MKHPVVAPSTLDASTALVLQSCIATQSSPARTRARRGTVVADESFYELTKQHLDEDTSITIGWDNETTQTKRKIRTALVDLSNKIISSSDCKRNRDFFLPLPTAVTRPGSCSARQRGQRHQLSLYRQPYRFWSCPTSSQDNGVTNASCPSVA